MAREDVYKSFIDEIDSVLTNVKDEKVLDFILHNILPDIVISTLYIFEDCESPIEQLLGGALIEALKHDNLYIGTQEEIQVGNRKYRADFMIQPFYGDSRCDFKIDVECDGHDFHEKTKEQAARDKRRDRSIQAKGIPVLRFTGSEIWNDPKKCAKEVRSFVLDHIERMR